MALHCFKPSTNGPVLNETEMYNRLQSAKDIFQSIQTKEYWKQSQTVLRETQIKLRQLKEHFIHFKTTHNHTTRVAHVQKYLSDGLFGVELLCASVEYVNLMYHKLKTNHKLVKHFMHTNKHLQLRVLEAHAGWLQKITERSRLEKHLQAWLFASNMEQASINLNVNSEIDKSKQSPPSFSRVCRRSKSKLPWIHVPESVLAIYKKYEANNQLQNNRIHTNIAVELLPCNRVLPFSQRYRYTKECAVDLLNAVNFFNDLAVCCHLANMKTQALGCVNYAFRLLFHSKGQQLSKAQNRTSHLMALSNLMLPASEKDWATLLNICHKCMSVLWSSDREIEALALLHWVTEARRNFIHRTTDLHPRFPSFACLINGCIFLFLYHVNAIALPFSGRQSAINILSMDLGLVWAEGAMSSIVEQYSGDVNNPRCRAPVLLWMLIMESLCRLCTNLGSTADVILLTGRMFSVLEQHRTKPDRHLIRTTLKALDAEINHMVFGTGDNALDDELDSEKNTGVEIAESWISVESVLNDVKLCCGGQGWQLAVRAFECLSNALKFKHEATTDKNHPDANRLRGFNSDDDGNNNRNISLEFLRHLCYSLSRNGSLRSQEHGVLASQLLVGKHREYGPKDLFCNFRHTDEDPRLSIIAKPYAQYLPLIFARLRTIMPISDEVWNTATGPFILRSNQKLFHWYTMSHASGEDYDILLRYETKMLLELQEMCGMWDDLNSISTEEYLKLYPKTKANLYGNHDGRCTVKGKRKIVKNIHVQPFPDLEPERIEEFSSLEKEEVDEDTSVLQFGDCPVWDYRNEACRRLPQLMTMHGHQDNGFWKELLGRFKVSSTRVAMKNS